MTIIKNIILLFIVISNVSISQNSTARFLLYQPSARSSAMAGAGSVIHDNAFSTYYNPAALISAPKISLVGSFQKPIPFFGNIVHSFIAASYSIESFGTIAASANLYWPGEQVWSNASGQQLGGIKSELNWQGKISFAGKLKENVAVAISLGYLDQTLVPDNIRVGAENRGSVGDAFMVDLGLYVSNIFVRSTFKADQSKQYSENNSNNNNNEGLKFGFVLRNLGPKVTQINKEQADPLPGQFIAGFLWNAFQSQKMDIDILIDIEKQLAESSSADYIRLGSEMKIQKNFFVRCGYALDTYGTKNSYPTVGVGVKYKFISIDIAYFNNTFDPIYHYSGGLFLDKGLLK